MERRDYTSILNAYSRKSGTWLISILSFSLIILLLFLGITSFMRDLEIAKEFKIIEDMEIVKKLAKIKDAEKLIVFLNQIVFLLYVLLITAAFPFSVNGFFMEKAFNAEIDRIVSTGLFIEGLEGFKDIESKIKLLYRGAYTVIIMIFISFLVFIFATALKTSIFIFTACVGLLGISQGASLVLKLPDKSALQPGGLLKFYEPRTFPLRLDNMLTDAIFTQLDPITRFRFDEWSRFIHDHLSESFLKDSNLDNQTRLERAREKIFLMMYFRVYFPKQLTEDNLVGELREILESNSISSFIDGKGSGISYMVLQKILKDMNDEIPEIFELLQRITVLVTENLWYLRKKEIFISVCHPTVHIGNIDPMKVIVFILNLQREQQKVQVQVQSSMSSLDPDDPSQVITLDKSELKLPENSVIKFHNSESVDVLNLVSAIMQIGDTISFQFRPNRNGTHIMNLSISNDEKGLIDGRSMVIDVKRDIKYYAKTMGAKVLSYVGAALSFIGISMGSLMTII